MKTIKIKISYFAVLAVLGIIMTLSGNFHPENSTVFGIGLGFTIISVAKILQFYFISKDDEKVKKFEVQQTEERLVFIATKSGNFSFRLTILVEYLAMIVLSFMGQTQIASVVCFVTAIQVLVYLILYFIYSKKY